MENAEHYTSNDRKLKIYVHIHSILTRVLIKALE